MHKAVKKIIEKLSKHQNIQQIWLFGSRARGDANERSDIDVAILCPKATDKDWLNYLDSLETIETLLEIDCIRLEQSSNELQNNILNDGKLLYEQ